MNIKSRSIKLLYINIVVRLVRGKLWIVIVYQDFFTYVLSLITYVTSTHVIQSLIPGSFKNVTTFVFI